MLHAYVAAMSIRLFVTRIASIAGFVTFAFVTGCAGTFLPSVDTIEPTSVDACSTVVFTGLFVGITKAYVVDSQGVQTPVVSGTLQPAPIPGTLFRATSAIPPVPVGTYRLTIDENGGSVFFLGNVAKGSATSKQTFRVANAVQPPSLMLTATNSPAPGAAATLTPSIIGIATEAIISPGNLSGLTGPRTVHACKTTKYTLTAADKCAPANPAQATVTVAGPAVASVSPTAVPAGSAIIVSGSGFNDPGFCGDSELSLVSGSTVFTQPILVGNQTALSAAVNRCVPPGTYNIVVRTAVGSSINSVRLNVTAPTGEACPSDGNECATHGCDGGTCAHKPLTGTKCGGGTGVCNAGTCVVPSPVTPPPVQACVQASQPPTASNAGECVPPSQLGPHCCNTASATAICWYNICRKCIPHGSSCPTGAGPASQICCDPNDMCVADAVTGAVACNVPG